MYNISFKIVFFLFLIPIVGLAQEGVIEGVLTSEDDGLPLPGASVIVKGTSTGVQTDFDGKYSIKCNVGDVLQITYLGMTTREIRVTAEMFGIELRNHVEKIPVKPLESDAYNNALKAIEKQNFRTLSIDDAKHNYNNKNYNALNRIKAINIRPEKVNLTYFNPDIYFQAGVNSNLSFQFVKKSNLPDLQSSFSQGATENGTIAFLGPETGTIFSYGPNLNTLEYDGSTYRFDTNGRLVGLGNGNGNAANRYDNSILNTLINSTTNAFVDIDTEQWTTGLDYSTSNSEDMFGRERNRKNNLALSFDNKRNYNRKITWSTFVKYSNWIDNQPNINGFTNNLLLSSWITPVSFSNTQGYILPDNTQRSFSPTNYNNPEWLFNNNRNSDANNLFVASLKNKFKIADDFNIESQVSYNIINNKQRFGLVTNTAGFEDGYLSNKDIKRKNFNASLNMKLEKDLGKFNLDISANTIYRNEHLDYKLKETEGFDDFTYMNPSMTSFVKNRIDRNSLRLQQTISLKYWRDSEITFSNNTYIASIQKNKLLLPSSTLKVDLADFINLYDFSDIILSVRSAYSVNEMPLFYNNQSHNSLRSLPSESLNYTSNIDLFINDDIALEEKHDYTFNLDLGFYFLELNWDFTASYFGSETTGSVFPVLESGAFQLRNIADISNKGFEFQLEVNKRYGDFNWETRLSFMTNKNEVKKLYDNQNRIPIAGFQTISKNLIVGKPAGVIVGSAYARDTNNNIIVGNDGFPIVDPEQQVIGDPIPDFTMGLSNRLEWKNFEFKLILDYQKGGDVWNGTQNVLNYFGTSKQSANERVITDFIFNGVDNQGNTNTIPVDFYNPQNGIENNRFVRYGFSGVAEDAIEDASYLNFRTIELSYDFFKNESDKFFRRLQIGIYAHNLFTITKYRGASPFASLFDTNLGNNLNFFNTPLMSEVGCKINLKI